MSYYGAQGIKNATDGGSMTLTPEVSNLAAITSDRITVQCRPTTLNVHYWSRRPRIAARNLTTSIRNLRHMKDGMMERRQIGIACRNRIESSTLAVNVNQSARITQFSPREHWCVILQV